MYAYCFRYLVLCRALDLGEGAGCLGHTKADFVLMTVILLVWGAQHASRTITVLAGGGNLLVKDRKSGQ